MPDVYKIKTSKSTNEKINSFFRKAKNELAEFYQINWVENPPILLLADSRKDFDNLYGRETESWQVGFSLGPNTLLLLSPEFYEKESSHKYSDEEYYSLIKHELGHLYYAILSHDKGPAWLDEGFAMYVSNEISVMKKPKTLKSFIHCYDYGNPKVYEESGFVVEGLIKKYGKEKTINFLKLLPNINREELFKKEFEKYFNIKLEYREIEKLL